MKTKKTKKHPAHEKESLNGGILHLAGFETDHELRIALESLGNTVTKPRPLEAYLDNGFGFRYET